MIENVETPKRDASSQVENADIVEETEWEGFGSDREREPAMEKVSKVKSKDQSGDQSKFKKPKAKGKEKIFPSQNVQEILPAKGNAFDILNGSGHDEADGKISINVSHRLTDPLSICMGLIATFISDIIVFG